MDMGVVCVVGHRCGGCCMVMCWVHKHLLVTPMQ